MAYTTGSATDLADLIDKIRIFLTGTAGYTQNAFSVDGTGHRLHVQKNSMFFNLRSFVNETVPNNGAANTYGIMMNASTGYNAGNNWYSQPGNFTYNSGTNSFITGINNINGAIVAYHFFHFASGGDYDAVYIIVESPSGTYNRLLFGRIGTASIGGHWTTPPEGMFYQGSVAHTNGGYSGALSFFGGTVTGWNTTNPHGALYGTVDGFTGWMSGNFGIAQNLMSPARPQVFDSIVKTSSYWLCSPNTFNSMPPLIPVTINVTRSTGAMGSTTPWSPVGTLPNLYWLNIFNVNPGSDITIAGSDTYKVFPFRKKSSTWTVDPNNGTYRLGFCIKTN